MKRITSLILLLFLNLPQLFTIHSLAYEEVTDFSEIVISEVMPNPKGSDTDLEWIELYNNGDLDINLENCMLDGITFPLNSFIPAKSLIVLTRDILDKDQDTYFYEKEWGNDSKIWGDTESEQYLVYEMNISLKNSDDFVVFECLNYSDQAEWNTIDEGQSLSLIDTSWTTEGLVTPGHENLFPEEISYSINLFISEIYPTPCENESEWIELFNPDESDINLIDWYLKDNTSKHFFSGEISIKSKEYLVIQDEELAINLNNSGETIYLINPDDEVVSEFEYISTICGISNILHNEEILQTKLPTPGKENSYVDPNDVFYGSETILISEFKNLEVGEFAIIEGTVSVEKDVLGTNSLYIFDKSGATKVNFSENISYKFDIGELIQLYGEKNVSVGEDNISVEEDSWIKKISTKNMVEVNKIKIKDIDNSLSGKLIFITGKIVQTSGSTFYINDGSGTIKITVKSSTDIKPPSKKKGQYAGVIGIISRYGKEDKLASYRIYPRYQTDIQISDSPLSYEKMLAVTGKNLLRDYSAALSIIFLLTLIYIKRFRIH